MSQCQKYLSKKVGFRVKMDYQDSIGLYVKDVISYPDI